MVVRLEAERDEFGLDGFVETVQLTRALSDSGPDHTDVVERREDAEAADGGIERGHAGSVDTALDGLFDLVESRVVDLAEERERDVCLFGVGEAESRRTTEPLLYVGDRGGETVREVDGDEEAHTRS